LEGESERRDRDGELLKDFLFLRILFEALSVLALSYIEDVHRARGRKNIDILIQDIISLSVA